MKRDPRKLGDDPGRFSEWTPRIFWFACDACGFEFKDEPVYNWKSADRRRYVTGCRECFKSADEFRAWVAGGMQDRSVAAIRLLPRFLGLLFWEVTDG